MDAVRAGRTPRQIMTHDAFENAIRVVMALGGSTNAVLHLLALAHEAEVPLSIDEFNAFCDTTPTIADLKPAGRYVMRDLDRVGGVQAAMKLLLDAGLLHGDCLTVNGRTVAENLADVRVELDGQDVLYPLSAPVKPTGPISVIKGNLAPEGAVLKSSGVKVRRHSGPARVFDEEESALRAILDGSIVAGDTIVIRYEGPRGGPGMREMLAPTSAIAGVGLIGDVALITDGRFSGGSHRHRRRPRRPGGAGRRTDRRGARGRHDHPRSGRQDDRRGPDGSGDRGAAARDQAGRAADPLPARRTGQVRAARLLGQPGCHHALSPCSGAAAHITGSFSKYRPCPP